jgi:preprotein translocase subunit SecG
VLNVFCKEKKFMSLILIIVHVAVCVALIMIVLLQTGKGADMGAAFGGGGSQTLFGSTGASTFLSKATTVAAIVFMLTSLVLAYMSSHRTADSIMPQTTAPVQQAAPASPGEAAPQESAAPAPAAPAEQGQTAPPENEAPAQPAQSE